VAALVATTLSAVPSAGAANQQIKTVALSYYPWSDNGFPSVTKFSVTKAQSVLDELAREYAQDVHRGLYGRATTSLDPQAFFMWWLPNRLFDIASGAVKPPKGLDMTTDAGMDRAMWLTHIDGYYFGTWLRKDFLQFQGHWAYNNVLDDAAVSGAYQQLETGRAAVNQGSGADVLAFNQSSLRGKDPTPSQSIGDAGDATGIYAYDLGFLVGISPPSVNTPPDATTPPETPLVTYSLNQLYEASYGITEPPYLAAARRAEATVKGAADTARMQAAVDGSGNDESLLARQQRLITAGIALWSNPALAGDITKWSQAEWDKLLTLTTYSVMQNQAMAMSSLAATSTGNVPLGRQAAREVLLFWNFGNIYKLGVGDPHNDSVSMQDALPHFVMAN